MNLHLKIKTQKIYSKLNLYNYQPKYLPYNDNSDKIDNFEDGTGEDLKEYRQEI